MKQFRHAEHTGTEEYVAEKVAEHWGANEVAARTAVGLNHIAGRVFGGAILADEATASARTLFSKELIPARLPNIPPPAEARVPSTSRAGAAAVYFHACVNRISVIATPMLLDTTWLRRWSLCRLGQGCRYGFRRTCRERVVRRSGTPRIP